MDTEPEELKVFNYLLYGADRPWLTEKIKLPVNRNLTECLDRVNQALLKRDVVANVKYIELYKPLKPLPINPNPTETDAWRAIISNPKGNSENLRPITHISSLDTHSESTWDDDIVHIVVFLNEVSLNYLLLHRNHSWEVDTIQLPVDQAPKVCLSRVNQALLQRNVMADVGSIEFYKPLKPLSVGTADWHAMVRNPKGNSENLMRVMPRSFVVTRSENFLDDNIVHLIIFLKEAAFNYLLFDQNHHWAVQEIQLPMNRSLGGCLGRVKQALLEMQVTADVQSIGLYKPWEPLLIITSETDEWRATIRKPNADFQRLSPSEALHLSFSEEELDNRKIVHLIITIRASKQSDSSPTSEETDTIAPLREFYGTRFRNFRKAYASVNAMSPSTVAKSSEFRKLQRTQAPIYDGRRAPGTTHNSSTIAMPPSLYHPVFEIWKKNAFDSSIKPPAGVVEVTAELMQKVTVLYENEKQRSQALRGPLRKLLGRQIDSIANADRTVADGCITIQLRRGQMTYNVPQMVIEEKREAAEGSDATTQATLSMIRLWDDPRLYDLCHLTCCPTFLLGFSGCQLTVSAAVIPEGCIVERLATLWIGRSSTHDQNRIEDTARVFHTLSMALEKLEQWYQSDIIANRDFYDLAANKPFNHPRFFPHANQYPVNGEDFDDTIKFEYLNPLETSSLCITFLAQAVGNPSDQLVVKFTQQYCPAVHRLLAGCGMAPALRYCGKIDESTPYRDWKMVVMDYYDGSPPTDEQAPKIREDVKKAVTVGHEAGFVFGDIRRPNVLVGKADGQVKLIDFDWAGQEGARYPSDMSDNEELWVAGMKPMAIIEKQHDLAMIDKWFPNK